MNTPEPRNDETAELLKRALAAEAADVSTDATALQRIQRRTAGAGAAGSSAPARQRWVLGAFGAAAATAAVITAVVVVGDQPDQGSPGPADTPTGTPTTSVVQRAPVTRFVAVTYVGPSEDDFRLFTESHGVESAGDPALAAVHEFLTGQPADPDYFTGWPEGLDVSGIDSSNGSIQVDLTGPAGGLTEPGSASSGQQERAVAVQALLRTAGGRVGDVATLTYNGDIVETALGVDFPVKVAADEQTRAFITIDGILDGQPLDNPVTVQVSGNVFEANVSWILSDDNGAKLDEGFVMVGSYGDWDQADIKLGTLNPGTYTIQALEYSAKDGSPTYVDDKTFTVG